MSDPEYLAEDEVTNHAVAGLFKRAFFSCEIDEDGDIVVKTDGPKVLVTVDNDKKLLKFVTIYGLKEEEALIHKHELVNRMNDDFILARFAVPDGRPDVLLADYFLSFEEGVLAFQVVSTLRLFSRVVPGAIQSSDEDDIVE